MSRNNFETRFDFDLSHKVVNGQNILTVAPSKADPMGVEPINLVLTDEQWNALRYHFVTAVNDRLKVTKLAYIY